MFSPMSKQVKLLVHQKTFSEDELVLNPKEFPNAKVGDIVEIYHPENDYSRLLLQVKSLNENKQQATKESVSVDQSIAAAFNLRTYKDVIVNIVNPEDVTLDLLELTFKDQYISRSDMWRLKNRLLNSCAYITRKVEFFGVRAQISELWSKGEKVACGVISADTKVVFRSSTAMIYLFIQMSSEMWEFDVYGDLHLEKAIEFLTELFTNWKEGNSYHDLNIVLFSRTYYVADTIDEFPVSIRECLQQDYQGRFYEDFYRIVAISERRDDWRPILVNMKKVFNEYQSKVIRTEVKGQACPQGYNSTSVQGNFLEAINMSLNVFDKHFVNRNFDRTGQLAILITPGAGVFEVDRELCNITKQRMIDNGIGSDLVCMAEQPLHAAPLFKFHNKMGYTNLGDDYNIPYWINHSFYMSKDQQQKQKLMPTSFIPRIKLPEASCSETLHAMDESLLKPGRESYRENSATMIHDIIDHNAYDAQVFKLPSHIKQGVKSQYLTPRRHEKYADRVMKSDGFTRKISFEMRPVSPAVEVPYTKSYSTNAMEIPNSGTRPRSNTVIGTNKKSIDGLTIMSKSLHTAVALEMEIEENLPTRLIVGSASMVTDQQQGKAWPLAQRMQRALINPFAPCQLIDRLTSNKRRWTHTFPLGPSGKAIHAHHHLAITLLDDFSSEHYSLSPPTKEVAAAESAVVEARKKASVAGRLGDSDSHSGLGFHSSASSSSLSSTLSQQSTSDSVTTVKSTVGSVINTYDPDYRGRSETIPSHSAHAGQQVGSYKTASEGWYWSVTGEQDWSPLIQSGVDWKSLTLPACLPITTDYFPDKIVMSKMYVESPYDLLADEVFIGKKSLTTEQVCQEFVSQRLMQGCQLIIQPQSQSRTYAGGTAVQQEEPDYLLSIGRIYHKINLSDTTIKVVRYRPRHIYPTSSVKYTYRLWPVDKSQYEPAYVTFDTDKLESFNWNYLDNYVCSCEDYGLMNSLKYWRSRFLLLPSNSSATKKITCNDGNSTRCDIYTSDEPKPTQQILEGFYKFVEVLNRIKKAQSVRKVNQTPSRPPSRRASSTMLSTLSQTPTDKDLSQTPKQSSIIATTSNDIATVTMSYTDGSAPPSDVSASSSSVSLDKDEKGKDEEKLNLKSPLIDVIKAMKDPSVGMTFLPTDQRPLPEHSFISGEAVNWLIHNLEDDLTEYQAIQCFQDMVDKDLICHASCLPKRKIPFRNGFCIYFITPESEDSSKSDWRNKRYTSFYSFDKDWFEVAVENDMSLPSEEPDITIPSSPEQWRTTMFRDASKGSGLPKCSEVIYDVDINNKSDRVEWCHIRYHKTYRTDSAFELEVHWLVATGCLIMDMVQSWARKAGSCGFHLIPATIDPFGMNIQYSDPLRRPLFIELQCDELLINCPQQVQKERIKFFQQEILKAFGFVQDPWSNGVTTTDFQQFVHTTGSAFAVIPKNYCLPDSPLTDIPVPLEGDEFKQHPFSNISTPGFYWMHNFMLTKRWRSVSTGDERFSEKLLTDFKLFCTNQDGRLKALWDNVLLNWSM